ncbi:MAG TPA: hypothetical protein VF695_09580 [Sphingomonas sp.]|jgi:hypothetical protein
MGEREVKAFAMAPLPVVVPLIFSIGVKAIVGDSGDAGVAGVLLAILAFVLISYGATLLIGIPIHLVLRRFRKRDLIHYVSAAVLPFVILAGAIAVWLQLDPVPTRPVNPFSVHANGGIAIRWTLVIAAVAALSATTFWYVGVRPQQS